MIYITGDTHGDFSRFEAFCGEHETAADDIMIILGDAGLNFYGYYKDRKRKAKTQRYPITFFCVHGNHERRPSTIETYRTKEFCGGTVWYEEEFPGLLFAKDGEIFRFGGRDCIVIGGAYSVDKYMRLDLGWPWFSNEQPSDEIKAYVEKRLGERGNKIDVILSHTCPLRYEPVETFSLNIDDGTVDRSTEQWLDAIEENTAYQKWYCGHFHIEKSIDRLRFMYMDIDEFK